MEIHPKTNGQEHYYGPSANLAHEGRLTACWLVGFCLQCVVPSFQIGLFGQVRLLQEIAFEQSSSFLNLKTGKWSMADVMVIAIFMAYIGFTGIITEQLKQIEKITPTLDLLTTNNSNLRTGFVLFTAFAILSLLVSHKLQYEFKTTQNDSEKKEGAGALP